MDHTHTSLITLARRPPLPRSLRYVLDKFSATTKRTLGVDFMHYHRSDGLVVQLWDIAGQERYGAMARVYYKDALGAVIVYDATRPKTFEDVLKWKSETDEKVKLPDGSPIPVILAGNKCDLERAEGCDAENFPGGAEAFCQEHGFIGWLMTSAKEKTNISEAIGQLCDAIMEREAIWQPAPAEEEIGHDLSAQGGGRKCC